MSNFIIFNIMRDDFPKRTKTALASRVAWRCSYPNCNRITIGPKSLDDSGYINLGEAAHICAASEKGPRFDPQMTSDERSNISNGIWLCTSHAKLIDADYSNYSPSTIQLWKKNAEENIYRALQNLSTDIIPVSTTLISLKKDLSFWGIWSAANDTEWKFEVESMFQGNIEDLKNYSINNSGSKYVVIESQGDGRELDEFAWAIVNNKYEIICQVRPKSPRTDPYIIGSDIALGDDFDLKFENGDFVMTNGVDTAIQILRLTLSTKHGEWWASPASGSHFRDYFEQNKTNLKILNSLLKVEITRLLTVSVHDNSAIIPETELSFIKRVLDAQVLSIEPNDGLIPVRLKLEWGNGEQWEGRIVLGLD